MSGKTLYKIKVKHVDSAVVEVEADTEFDARNEAVETVMKKNESNPDSQIYSIELVDKETIADYHKTISEDDYSFDVHVNVVRKPQVVHLKASITRENTTPEVFKVGWTCRRNESHTSRVRSEVAKFIGNFIQRKM